MDGSLDPYALKRSKHESRGICFFPSCPTRQCQEAQKNARLYGFDSAGEINTPSPRRFPWESDAA